MEKTVAVLAGESVTVDFAEPESGGCINRTARLRLQDGRTLFVKWNHYAPQGMFAAEMLGLETLARPGVLRIPRPFDYGDEPISFLLLEDLKSRHPFYPIHSRWRSSCPHSIDHTYATKLAMGLVGLHRHTADQFGFERDNFIGYTHQPNPWTECWGIFFAEHRIGHLRNLLYQQGMLDPDTNRRLERFQDVIPTLLFAGDEEGPSLLHGDLWGGNVLQDVNGSPCLIDPAVYFGHREVDIAMTQLFGGFPDEFLPLYDEAWPLLDGYEERRDIYNSYHLLNHALLFGGDYLKQAMSLVRRFVV